MPLFSRSSEMNFKTWGRVVNSRWPAASLNRIAAFSVFPSKCHKQVTMFSLGA